MSNGVSARDEVTHTTGYEGNKDVKHLEIQGERVPALGFGTWQLLGQDCVEGVRDALEIGYRRIDTAQAYDNESEVGQGMLKESVDYKPFSPVGIFYPVKKKYEMHARPLKIIQNHAG